MKKDRNDDAAFRNSRDQHMGVSVSNEFYQPVPMFFTREGAQLNLIGHYRGKSAFLICNGPSFASLNKDLLNKPGIVTFGINNGPKTFRPTFWTCVDDPERFLKSIWLDSRITKFIPQAHFEKPIFDNEKWEPMKIRVGECPNVVGYRRNEKFMADRFLFEDTINWGNHKDYGGGRSVMLPAFRILFLLGFRKVYLLGCDMKMTEKYTYHFDEQRSKGAVHCNMDTYDRLKSDYLPALKPIFDAEGFKVFNCNPESELKVFPFLPFEDAIKEASKDLGDVPNERVWGMYSSPEEKSKWRQEPPKEQKAHLQTLAELQSKKIYEKPNIVVPYLPPTVPPAPESMMQTNESQGCEDPELPRNLPPAPLPTSPENYQPPMPPPPFTLPPPPPTLQGSYSVHHEETKANQVFMDSGSLPVDSPVKWNPYNKVVIDHRNGSIDIPATNNERQKRGLVIPWTPEIGEKEIKEPPIQ